MAVDVEGLRRHLASAPPGAATAVAVMLEALDEIEQLREALAALVAALPKCAEPKCENPALWELDKDLSGYLLGYCDDHAQDLSRNVDWEMQVRTARRLLATPSE